MALQRMFKRVCLNYLAHSFYWCRPRFRRDGVNSSGDVFFTATAEEFDRKKKGEKGALSNAIIINAALE